MCFETCLVQSSLFNLRTPLSLSSTLLFIQNQVPAASTQRECQGFSSNTVFNVMTSSQSLAGKGATVSIIPHQVAPGSLGTCSWSEHKGRCSHAHCLPLSETRRHCGNLSGNIRVSTGPPRLGDRGQGNTLRPESHHLQTHSFRHEVPVPSDPNRPGAPDSYLTSFSLSELILRGGVRTGLEMEGTGPCHNLALSH